MHPTLGVDELIDLNGHSGFEKIRERGIFSLPTATGLAIDIDIALPHRAREILIEEYWRSHPRFIFFKTVPANASLMDLGAGTGGLIEWKTWGQPSRQDIYMYAVDRTKGDHFDRYVDYDLTDLCSDETKYPNAVFDAVICSHVLDFAAEKSALISEIARISRPGAKIYVEWPSEKSNRILSRDTFNAFGILCYTMNFGDDSGRTSSIALDDAKALFQNAGLRTVAGGEIANDYLFPELFRCGYLSDDREIMTYALWLALGVVNYLVLERVAQP